MNRRLLMNSRERLLSLTRKGFVSHGTLDVGRNLEQILKAYALFQEKDEAKPAEELVKLALKQIAAGR